MFFCRLLWVSETKFCIFSHNAILSRASIHPGERISYSGPKPVKIIWINLIESFILYQHNVRDSIFVSKSKHIKIGDMLLFPWKKISSSSTAKFSSSGGRPEYWAPEQGQIFDSLLNSKSKDQQEYLQTLNFLPLIGQKVQITPNSLFYSKIIKNNKK